MAAGVASCGGCSCCRLIGIFVRVFFAPLRVSSLQKKTQSPNCSVPGICLCTCQVLLCTANRAYHVPCLSCARKFNDRMDIQLMTKRPLHLWPSGTHPASYIQALDFDSIEPPSSPVNLVHFFTPDLRDFFLPLTSCGRFLQACLSLPQAADPSGTGIPPGHRRLEGVVPCNGERRGGGRWQCGDPDLISQYVFAAMVGARLAATTSGLAAGHPQEAGGEDQHLGRKARAV